MDPKPRIIGPHGGYRNLRSYRTAQTVYDGTVIFCKRFLEKRDRTYDQMVQAARSGVQNIAEGSMASVTSRKTELKLTGVARASLEELLLDYEAYLRQHGLRQWDKQSPEALHIRNIYQSDKSDVSDPSDPYSFQTAPAPAFANTMLCLINQATWLLNRQISKLEQLFIDEGGFTERLYRVRTQARKNQCNETRKR